MPEQDTQQKPIGPFEDFEACVSHFEGDEEVDDPEALCGWMEENKEAQAVQQYAADEGDVQQLVDAMKEPSATNVLTDLQVTYVSGVENPAQDSQWVMAKDADTHGADWGVNAPLLLCKDQPLALQGEGDDAADEGGDALEEQQKAWAAVLIPNETDKQGDVIPPEAIEKAAHQFLATYRKIDTDHDLFEGKGSPIESWTLKESRTFELPDGSDSREYPAGTWMMGVRFCDNAWERIKSGELTGFSIYGEATSHDVEEILGGDVELDIGESTGATQASAATAGADSNVTMKDNEEADDEGGTEKQLPADVLNLVVDSINAYLAEADTEVADASIEEFLQWGLDTGEIEADSIEVGGVELTPSNGEPEEGEENGGEEEEPEEAEMSDTDTDEAEEGESEASTKELLEEVRDTVKSTQESVESHGERLDALEEQVFEKEDEQDTGGEQAEEPEIDVEEEAEKAVKDILGLEELPEDQEERQEVLRKHLHEQDEPGSALGNPDEWTAEDTEEVIR